MKTAQLLLASGYNRDLNPGRLWVIVTCGMVLMLLGASRFSWEIWAFWEATYGLPMVALVVLAYLASAMVSSRLRLLPRAEGLGVIVLAVTLGFLAVVAILAFGRIYYSRSFLFTAWFFSLTWLPLSYFLGSTAMRLTLAVVSGGMSDELVGLPGIDWKVLRDPEGPGQCNGVVVDLHQKLSGRWVRFLSDCSLKRIPIYHSAVVYEALTGKVSLSHLSDGLLEDFKLAPLYAGIKRGADLVVVILTALFMLPLVFLVALAIRMDSVGPVLFWQERVGQGGESFRIYKFRSMCIGAEREEASFACRKDQRITRVGKVIRRFRLDELPQLWNILKGDMSLIGPRPEQVPFSAQFEKEIPFYAYRHLVKPGLTGWAQVTQGYAAGVDQNRAKLEHDLYYIKYFSFWLDLWILGKTLRTVLTGFGAR